MGTDDPFVPLSDSDRTQFRPMPGRRGIQARPQPVAPIDPVAPAVLSDLEEEGVNPLVGASADLLAAASQLRITLHPTDPQALRQRVEQQIQHFEARARERRMPAEVVLAGRYALCALLDEAVLNTPWGSESAWAHNTLLSAFHGETWGGEKFFQILERALQAPESNLDLLELMYVCLALGFEGKYRIHTGGRAQLANVRDKLYRTIRDQRGQFEPVLAPQWQGVEDRRNPLMHYVPLWVVGVLAVAGLFGIYSGYRYSLNNIAEPVYQQLSTLGSEINQAALPSLMQPDPRAPRPQPFVSQLSMLLQPEINAGRVEVVTQNNGAVVRIVGDNLFHSGSTVITAAYEPLIDRISRALVEVSGRIVVVGHTDDVPVRSLKFNNNWELSRQRAVAVAALLEQHLPTSAWVTAEGRADTEPLVPNDSRDHRARNRRVEIEIYPPAAAR